MKFLVGMIAMALTGSTALAQGGQANVYTSAQLQSMAQQLEQQESMHTTGSAGETLEKYSNHYTMLTIRNVSGGAEVHEHYADIFFVVDGEATLTTGGTVVDPQTTAPGEIRGTSVQGGIQRKLGKGDVVHISPDIPHQLTIAKGKSFTYFVVKIQE